MEQTLTDVERKELVEKLQIQDELERRIENNRLQYFTPTGKQEEFISEIGTNKHFIYVLSAANAVGKTALLVNILGNFIFDNPENDFFGLPLYKNFPYPKRARIVSTPKNLEEIGAIQTEIKKWWPKGKYQSRKNKKSFNSEYIANGWVVDLMSFDQDASEFESATCGVIIFDEPPPEKILWASIARMRMGGIIMIFMTPLDNGGEILEDLTQKETIELDGKQIGSVYVLYSEIEDACIEHGIRGFLKHENILQMLSFYDPDEKDARAKGKPTHLIGRIYPDFEVKDPYVVDDFMIPEDWGKVCIIDPHDGIPFAITWGAIDHAGQVWIYDEFPFEDLEKLHSTNMTIPDYARIIREKEGRNKILQRIIDPYFANKRYSNSGLTIKQELLDLGLNFEDGDTSGLDVGHKRVREFLKYIKTQPVRGTNHPTLHIFKSCRNHWRSLLRYKRKLNRSGEVKDKIALDETYKHFCDNIRHLIMKADFQRLKGQQNYYDWYADEDDDDEELMPHERYKRTIQAQPIR